MNKAIVISGFSLAFAFSLFATREARAADAMLGDQSAAPPVERQPKDAVRPTDEEGTAFKPLTITANPLSLAIMRFGVNVEYLPATHHAIVANPFYQSSSVEVNGQSSTYSVLGGELGYHYYTGEKGANGFFIGPSLVAMNASGSSTVNGANASTSTFAYGAALDLGGQHVFDNGFTIGGGVGAMYLVASNDSSKSSSTFKTSGVLPRILFTIGYSF